MDRVRIPKSLPAGEYVVGTCARRRADDLLLLLLLLAPWPRRLPPAACRLPPAACRLPPAACRLPPAACHLCCSCSWLMLRLAAVLILPAVGFRWDCEESNQIWQSCGDVSITA